MATEKITSGPGKGRTITQQLTLALELLELLQAHEYTTVQALAEQLGRSPRTVQRVVAQLRQAGLQVYSGQLGYGMPRQASSLPCLLTEQEQVALSLLRRLGMPSLGEQSLSRRLRRNLSDKSLQQLDNLERLVASDGNAPSVSPEVWEPLSQALARQLQVRFQYLKLTDTESSTRSVEPWGLLRRGSAWYLHGFDQQRQEPRTFRLNRIQQLHIVGLRVERPPDFEANQARFHPWDIGAEPAIEAELEVSLKLARWLEENPAHPDQRLQGTVLQVVVKNREFFVDWLIGLRGAHLRGPEELRQLVQATLEERLKDLLRPNDTA